MQFVTSCYGQAFAPFLAVLLRSVRLSNPGTDVLVLHDDISPLTIGALKANNPSATFVAEGDTSDVQDKIKRIGAKTTFWLRGMEMTEADQVVFLDCDMIVRSRIDNALPADADMLVTVKPEQIPINTGFVIVRRNERTLAFMTEWDRFTQDVARAKTDYSISGGPDQHALLQMMGTMRPEPGGMTVHGIKIHLAPCSVYNETNSVPISAPAKVLHYKGPWHGMLIRGKRYSRHRPRDTSMAMRRLWRSYLLAEERELGMPLLPLVPRIKSLARDWHDKRKDPRRIPSDHPPRVHT